MASMSDDDQREGAAKSVSDTLTGGRIGPVQTGKPRPGVKFGEPRPDEDDLGSGG